MRGGLPHSEIPGSTIARISPGLFAACHVLHRLSVPRHPPDALPSRFSRHTQRQRPSSAAILSVQKTLRDGTHRPETPPLGATPAAASVAVTQLASSQLSINKHPAGLKPVGNSVILPRSLGWFRPLSAELRSACRAAIAEQSPGVEVNGLEPSTSGLQSRRSPS